MRAWFTLCFLVCTSSTVAAQTVNGCTRATATDMTAQSQVTITFPNGNFTYSPKCVKVVAGTQVTFNGAFSSHPLAGGEVVNGNQVPANSGPFHPTTSMGTIKSVTLAQNGDFPYYCDFHFGLGMNGVVYVGPDPLPPEIFGNGFE